MSDGKDEEDELPALDLNCMQCGQNFYLSGKDRAFFQAKNFQIPKRCWRCRQERKAAREKGPSVWTRKNED